MSSRLTWVHGRTDSLKSFREEGHIRCVPLDTNQSESPFVRHSSGVLITISIRCRYVLRKGRLSAFQDVPNSRTLPTRHYLNAMPSGARNHEPAVPAFSCKAGLEKLTRWRELHVSQAVHPSSMQVSG
ncbi:hypothetical protein CI238_01083 [Colletotrichum incanum]|uniref:Uncharacterized protein n=1 Tax=Colletotrichum incanum TaxID=1573173 RepID=A0A166Q2R1_COLIC|nr:hypothetical protein CI238_01083 [Colletotrichum incanum]